MRKVVVSEVDQFDQPADHAPGGFLVADALGATDVAVNYYELAPGETFSGGYHTHHDQEELFIVLEGVGTFETEDGPVRVAAGEAVRFAPGEFHHGHNASDDRVVGIAIGAPAGSDDVEVLLECPGCGERTYDRRGSILSGTATPEDVVVECAGCGTIMESTTEPR